MHNVGMPTCEAQEVLGIGPEQMTAKAITSAYHRLALKHHPDMTDGSDAAFVRISDAKEVLLERAEKNTTQSAPVSETQAKVHPEIDHVVKAFLSQLTSAQITTVWALSSCTDTRALFGESVVSELQKQIREVCEVITIKPTIASALAQLVYPLQVKGETFYVPLWHSRVEFDCRGRILIVNIDTVVPSHVTIDIDNIIHVRVAHRSTTLLRAGYLDVCVGDRTFRLWASSISTVQSQSISLGRIGLPRVNCCDPLDVDSLMEIMVHLTLSPD